MIFLTNTNIVVCPSLFLLNLDQSLRILTDVLNNSDDGSLYADQIISQMTTSSNLKTTDVESVIRLARRFGFIKIDEKGFIKTSIEGNEFGKFLNSSFTIEEEPKEIPIDETSLSVTLPPFCLPLSYNTKTEINSTSTTMKRVVSDAQKELTIVTPFLDISLLQMCFENVRRKRDSVVRILTSEPSLISYRDTAKGNLKLEEIRKLLSSRFKSGQVFYLEKEMSIAHAKIFCSDKSMFITSANIKKDSISENFEAGIYTERKDIINTTSEVILHVMESGAKLILDINEKDG